MGYCLYSVLHADLRTRDAMVHIAFIVFSLLLTSSSCHGVVASKESQGLEGGPCRYEEIPGVATITAIQEPDAGEYSCKQAKAVFFEFTPNDPAAVAGYRFPDRPDTAPRLTVGAGMNPPRNWVEEQGISVGARMRCLRVEIISGTCPPVTYVFPDLDKSGWRKWCW